MRSILLKSKAKLFRLHASRVFHLYSPKKYNFLCLKSVKESHHAKKNIIFIDSICSAFFVKDLCHV